MAHAISRESYVLMTHRNGPLGILSENDDGDFLEKMQKLCSFSARVRQISPEDLSGAYVIDADEPKCNAHPI